MQLCRGEDDPVLPNPYYAEAVRKDLPSAREMRVVPLAGHTISLHLVLRRWLRGCPTFAPKSQVLIQSRSTALSTVR